MLINCSNHPSRFWGASQKEAAKVYGETVDLPFPKVEPWFDTEDLRALVRKYAEKIESLEADAVLLAGEFTFMFMLVDKLLNDGVHVICTCSSRNTEEVLRPESAGDRIELLLSREEELGMDPDLVFEEEVLVKPQYAERGDLPEKLTIINRYRYSENDTLTLENYRISCNTEKINV